VIGLPSEFVFKCEERKEVVEEPTW
jgi:hypothetical protein